MIRWNIWFDEPPVAPINARQATTMQPLDANKVAETGLELIFSQDRKRWMLMP
jgi:hypothetical protein